jgi:hypothetical protein
MLLRVLLDEWLVRGLHSGLGNTFDMMQNES